jgi:hypothetical protein
MAGTASAQFTPTKLSDPATGEKYHIEASAGLWHPSAAMSISSESLGIPGDTIDFKKDLGLADQTFKELHLILRPSKKTKFRFQYIPINYQRTGTITRDFIFNGQRYPISAQVAWDLNWKAYRFTYEYDFVSRDRGFGGLLLEAKYTDLRATLDSPTTDPLGPCVKDPNFVHEYACGRAPIPAIGAIVRVYVVPNISLTTELSGIDVPTKKYKAHYADFDAYGTVNINDYVGVQAGYRLFNVGYAINSDTGSFVLKGIYFGLVARY